MGMHCRQEEPQPRGADGYRRIEDRLHVDSTPKQFLRQHNGSNRVPDNDRHNGKATSQPGIESFTLGILDKMCAVSLQCGNSLRLPMHQLQRLFRSRRNDRRHSYTVDEGASHASQIINERSRTSDITAAADKRLGEGTHPYVDLAGVDIKMLSYPVAAPSKNAQCVRLID